MLWGGTILCGSPPLHPRGTVKGLPGLTVASSLLQEIVLTGLEGLESQAGVSPDPTSLGSGDMAGGDGGGGVPTSPFIEVLLPTAVRLLHITSGFWGVVSHLDHIHTSTRLDAICGPTIPGSTCQDTYPGSRTAVGPAP